MERRLSNFDTIIFDLGEVIVDLDYHAVIDEFARLTQVEKSKVKDLVVQSDYLYSYETGQMTDTEFISAVNSLFQSPVSEADFTRAWNMMIKGISSRRLDFLLELMKTHRVLLLSNTNNMHEIYFDQLVRNLSGKLMKDYVHVAYYSHHVGYRKPEVVIYQHVIDDQNLDPQRALFLDDRLDNVEGAREAGLHAVQVAFPDQIFEILR